MHSSTQHFFELLFAMTEKELRARYKNTLFGFFWLVANPLLQMFIIGFVFTFFMKNPIPYYNYYLFVGLLVWNFFSLSLTKTTPSIVFERSLISKSAFPREVIPLSIILSNFIHFLTALVLFIIPVLIIGTLELSGIPYIFAGLIFLIIFTIGISLLTTALNVRFRDINFFVQALLIIWFYATPIIYSFSIIPDHLTWLWGINPLTTIVQLLQHGFVKTPLPNFRLFVINAVVAVITCIIGIIIFRKESNNFDDWV